MKTIFAIIALLAACLHLSAHDADSTSLRPTFGVDFSSEVQTDFEKFRNANLLQLRAHVPLSRKLTFEAGALGSLVTGQELDVIDLQGISCKQSIGRADETLKIAAVIIYKPEIETFLTIGAVRSITGHYEQDWYPSEIGAEPLSVIGDILKDKSFI